MTFRFFNSVLLTAALAVSAFAADVSGKWATTFKSPDGQERKSSMTLKAEGAKLTGTMEGRQGAVEIQDGKVDGDNISFSVTRKFQDNEFKMNYKGKVAGDEMKLTIEVNGNEMEMTAKRVP